MACGENGLSDWDRVVVEGLADKVRWHSIHIYTGSDDYWTERAVAASGRTGAAPDGRA